MSIRILSAIVCGLLAAAPVSAFVIDGDLSDWGVAVADFNRSTYEFLPEVNLLAAT